MSKSGKNISKWIFGYNSDFGPDPESSDAGRLRACQMAAIVNTSVLTILAKLTCVFVVYFTFRDSLSGWLLGYWAFALCVFGALGLIHAFQSKARGLILTASPRAYVKAINAAACSGGLWAVMPIMLYPNISVEERVIIIAIMSGLMGGGVLSLNTVPKAMFVWLFLLTSGSVVALLQNPTPVNYMLLCLLVVYAIALLRAGNTMASTFAKNTIAGFELSRQKDTINVLLKDFAENAHDWLWEINKIGMVSIGKEDFLRSLKAEFNTISPGDQRGNYGTEHHQTLNMRSLDELRNYYNAHKSFRDIVISSFGSEGAKWVSLSGKPIYNDKNEFAGFRGVASDITDKKKSEERIAYLAHNDALTGLVNRANFSRALDDLLQANEANLDWSVFYLDLDGFKAVNDTHGHSMGDNLLLEVAKRLKRAVSDKDIVARLGGDEFAILCKSAGSIQSVSTLAEVLLKEVGKPYNINEKLMDIGVSIGIALRNSDGSDAHTLLNNADLALYRAKAEGRGTFRLYEHQMDEIVKERRSLEGDLKKALKNGELSLCYQPLISARETKTVSFEALARWTHPERGSISPADFIPIAEAMGIITEIGEWVLREACQEASNWPDTISVAVNLSPQQFQSGELVETVSRVLDETGLPPKRLELEITESLFIENTDQVMQSLNALKEMGVSISLDDFGTGYSSLSYLLKFPFDKLKIDRSLVNSISHDENAKNVLEAITKLASIMKLTVTAEGVESLEQIKILLNMHCTHFQGFLFGKPLKRDELSAFLIQETIPKPDAMEFSETRKTA